MNLVESHLRGAEVERVGAYRTGNGLAMAAGEARGALPGVGGFSLAVKSDVFLVRTTSDALSALGAGNLAAGEAGASRVRAALEASRALRFGGRSVTPWVELGVRRDGGAVTGRMRREHTSTHAENAVSQHVSRRVAEDRGATNALQQRGPRTRIPRERRCPPHTKTAQLRPWPKGAVSSESRNTTDAARVMKTPSGESRRVRDRRPSRRSRRAREAETW